MVELFGGTRNTLHTPCQHSQSGVNGSKPLIIGIISLISGVFKLGMLLASQYNNGAQSDNLRHNMTIKAYHENVIKNKIDIPKRHIHVYREILIYSRGFR